MPVLGSGISLHTYTAGETGLFVNSYLIETESGVVVVDTNLLNSDIAALKARLTAVGKPLEAVFVTHAHPDHFNGVFELTRDADVPVYATAGVAKAIEEIADAKRAQWGPVYGEQWPAGTAYPTVELADGQTVDLGGLTLTAHEIGPAESHADSYLVATPGGGQPFAFIGDLAFHGTHPYTNDGHSGAWLAALDVITAELGDMSRLYPGHGEPADTRLFADQRRYLLHYRELIRRLADGAPALTDLAKAELERALTAFLPGAPLTWMIQLGADAIAAELRGDADGRDR
ncbi:MBL fold metallo-hydrolase [Streptomyces sp. H10-C2]|uniref:MBL fold metallo-hydrolase n=1 Tax=unclassified Streptomyces TaxID=2593676 RepID=UPI0024B95109|nr:MULTISPECIES: MBL fold metallo-hydrolase [unclassified Streptomyces]MDJ0343644.1 MBL fold metallo-hydrolase [Streptomyces sp. PH10-H1]MDJ0373108.1 MBL fold metallo-hydrolase [Streptomyces sp. H10-C2]